MAHPTLRLTLAAVGALLLGMTVPLPAEDAGNLFDPNVLHEIRISISSRDLQQMRDRYQENIHYPADIQWRGLKVRNAAVRSRGLTSRSATKLGIQIDFDRYTTGQRFVGLRSLVLDNHWQDPSMLRERVAMAFFERMGEPAPRVSFAKLFINNAYQGLYGVVEPVDDVFLQRTIGQNNGYLFEYKKLPLFRGEYLGDELDPYKSMFEPRNHQMEPDSVLYSPIRDLFREANKELDGVWRERVEERLHLSQFVTHVAIETFLAEDDGVLGSSGMSNFYLYRYADSNVHRLIPWDKDLTFAAPDRPLMLRTDENEVFRRALEFEDLRALYVQRLTESARAAWSDAWLSQEVTSRAALIADAVYADPLKPFSNEDFDAGIAELKTFARYRPWYVGKELGISIRR
jgi:spore coat protein CotH